MDNDGTDPRDNPGKEPSLLAELSHRQEEIKAALAELRADTDKTFVQGQITSFPDEDNLVAVTLVLVQMSRHHDRAITTNDMVWAMEFLDHLDTLGKQIAPKGVIVRS